MHYNHEEIKEINVYRENGEDYLDKKQIIIINTLFEYSDDILLYIYIFTDDAYNYLAVYFLLPAQCSAPILPVKKMQVGTLYTSFLGQGSSMHFFHMQDSERAVKCILPNYLHFNYLK